MSISSFCLEQREKEKAAFKSVLTYSIVGSAALHLVLAFGIALLWSKEPSLADDPIEIVLLDAPEPEVKKPEPETPKPTPQPVVTPTPEKPIAKIPPEPTPEPKPEPIPTPKIDTPPPTKVETTKPPIRETPVEPKQVNEPIKTPSPPKPETSAETLPPPKTAQEKPNNLQPLQNPVANPRDFRDQIAESSPVEPEKRTEETPQLPGGLTENQQPQINNSPIANQPLQTSIAENREFRDRIAATDTTPTNPGDDAALTNPALPGTIQQPQVNNAPITSQPLQSPTRGNREFRDRIAATDNAPTNTNPSNDTALTNPGLPGTVQQPQVNNAPVTSQPLQSPSRGNRGFRDSFANSNSPPGTSPSNDFSNAAPGTPGQVTANRQTLGDRPVGNSQPLQTATNNRGFRDSFTNNNSDSPSGTSNTQPFPATPGTSTGVAVNQPPTRNTRPQGENSGGDRTARRDGPGGRLQCVSGCNPEYPPELELAEGRPVIRFVVQADGSTVNPQLVETSGNRQLDQAAVEAVQKMRFAPPKEGTRTVRLAINFATSGSDFERQARQRREENERLRREKERQLRENLNTEN
jgi:TonB family protein